MSKLPKLEAVSNARAIDSDIVFVFQSDSKKPISTHLPKAYAEMVHTLNKNETFTGALGSFQLIRFSGKKPAEHVLFVGCGKSSALTRDQFRTLGGQIYAKIKAEKISSAAFSIDDLSFKNTESYLRAFLEGLVLPHYEFTKHRAATAKTSSYEPKFTFVTHSKDLQSKLKDHFDEVLAHLEAANICRDWSNEPSNVGTPEYFANYAKSVAKKYGVKCTVLSEKDCAREKMGLFLAVGQGSEREGKMVILEYTPKKRVKTRSKTIALVGKGITFDSGGISIKPSVGMEGMKHDMTGAATLFAATLLAAKWEVPHRIVTVLAFTENMPSGIAIQPGNIIKGRAGKTVEINNTDAEGRLILADALDYAQDFKPDVILDAATLTGAIGMALGKYYAGVFTNDEGTWDKLKKAATETGDKLWLMPTSDEYFEDMKSENADMRNIANEAGGGASRGAVFLKQFIKKDTPWIHMDIAYTANGLTHVSYYPKKGATGAHVNTVVTFIRDYV